MLWNQPWNCHICKQDNEKGITCKYCGTLRKDREMILIQYKSSISTEELVCKQCGKKGYKTRNGIKRWCNCALNAEESSIEVSHSSDVKEHIKTEEEILKVPAPPLLLFQNNSIRIENFSSVIGRGNLNFIDPNDLRFISDSHITVTRSRDYFYIEDISRNGTQVNYKDLIRYGAKRLRDGDDISLAHRALGDKITLTFLQESSSHLQHSGTFTQPIFITKTKKKIPINPGLSYIGRAHFKDIYSEEDLTYVSSNHLKVIWLNNLILIEDGRGCGRKKNGSSNGTLFNGKKIKKLGLQPIKEGDVLILGRKVKLRLWKGG